ncbi:lytic murein transglycosylase B [Marinoscillum furvescens]|uniref:Membrane-bound lytic murein transglycosylase B n=1 Tax=Marinoscillum furvescens DSM 4134 TaxID=1122208 RepID=A0A3D9L510_MARFU|nr:lytic murein transglycosylase B [Marinoscillum furvescens]RED99415.1 membrane-bound lytic murein transglycosylase B [Marinoscillum furvescens DSM 4134]
MRRNLMWLGLCLLVTVSSAQVNQSKVSEFARSYAERHDMTIAELTVILNNAEYQQSTVDKISRPAEGTMTWGRYRNIFLQDNRIQAGVEFWKTHEEVLVNVSEDSGVPEEIILGILGVETFFGQRIGDYRVLDALYTLAFGYPKRSSFFTAELEKFLELTEKEGLDLYSIKGSYAGAIGYCQFMPSSYLAYAKSYGEGDGCNLMEPEDAIASAANYLREHRWETGGPIAARVAQRINPKDVVSSSSRPRNTLRYYADNGYMPSGNIAPARKAALLELEGEEGMEYWFGFHNFYVITRYNHSALYAMAVFQLAEAIKEARERDL